jgi:hypothetical protein
MQSGPKEGFSSYVHAFRLGEDHASIPFFISFFEEKITCPLCREKLGNHEITMKNDNKPEVQNEEGSLSLLKGGEEFLRDRDRNRLLWDEALKRASQQLSEAFSARHLSFLLGSGASSLNKDRVQLGIPTMGPLAAEFIGGVGAGELYLSNEEYEGLKATYGIDIKEAAYTKNLEKLLEILFSLQFVLSKSKLPNNENQLALIKKVINKIKKYILKKCTEGAFHPATGDEQVLDVYKRFYRKLTLRDRSLPRPWVFTTNYDLFNERAMDQLGLAYCNGFVGSVERRFNPSTYRYSLAEQLDISEKRWSVVDGFVYFSKLHGSISWIEDGVGLYPIRELQEPSQDGSVIIYPTPAKQNSSFGSPYSDMFREFQSRIARDQSVLFVIGYSFGDEHVNNIIYQSLTIPTFRLVIFGSVDSSPEIKKLNDLCDPRIWIVSGRTPSGGAAHYFNSIVENLLPLHSNDQAEVAIANVIEKLLELPAGSQKDDK